MAKKKKKQKKKKVVSVDGYWRKSYGKRHWVSNHKRGHRRSIRLKNKPGHYETAGEIHKYDPNKDLSRYAPNRRGKKEARWRGDYLRGKI